MATHYIHRGLAKKNLEENTIPAFKCSFKKKYGVETDLHATKDNRLVCFHYYNLYGKFNKNIKIKNINYSYLKKISNKKKEKVPLLNDLIKMSRNKYPLLLEIKPILRKNNLLSLIRLLKKKKNME